MTDQNKNTGTAQSGTTSKPTSTEHESTGKHTQQHEQNGPKTPNHEQGREHSPNVNAQHEAADERRKTEQAHVPSATSRGAEKPSGQANDRKENEAGDAKRTMAEGNADQKPKSDNGKIVGDREATTKN
jgi:hypothetical protein